MDEFTSSLITGILFMVFIVAGGMAIIGQFRASDSTFATGDNVVNFNASFQRIDDITNLSTNLKNSLPGSPSDTPLGFLDSLGMGIFGAIKGIFGSIGFFTDSLTGLTTIFGVPEWITGLFTVLIVLSLFFAIGGAILGRNL